MTQRTLTRSAWRWLPAAVAMLALVVAVGVLTPASVGAAGQVPFPETPVLLNADDGEEDPFAVSDESLASSIFIPSVFIVATAAVFIWAWSRRVKPNAEADDQPMPWWRTHLWYSGAEDED